MNGSTFVIYTTQEGGHFQVCRCSETDYLAIKEAGKVRTHLDDDPTHPDYEPRFDEFVFLALLRVEDNHDFVMGRSRDDDSRVLLAS